VLILRVYYFVHDSVFHSVIFGESYWIQCAQKSRVKSPK